MHAVRHIADVQFFRQIAAVHVGEYLLGNLAVEPRYAVDVLGAVCCENTHAEALIVIVDIDLAQSEKGFPTDAET